jgi:hypothetical protein
MREDDGLGITLFDAEKERAMREDGSGEAPPEGAPLLGEPEEAPKTLRAAPQAPPESADLRPRSHGHSHAPSRLQRMLLAQPAAALLILAVAGGLSLDVASRRSPPRARPQILVAALRTLSHPVIAAPQTDAAAQPMALKEAEGAAGAQTSASAGNTAGAASGSGPATAAPASEPTRARSSGAATAAATPPPTAATPPHAADADAHATPPAPAAMSDEKLTRSWLAKLWSRGIAKEGAPPGSTQQ